MNIKQLEITMGKNRLEALSDGVFAIVMTLLILEIKLPEGKNLDNVQMLHELTLKIPLFAIYFLSFALLTNFWIAHHFMFAFRAKNVDRIVILLNCLYLSLLSLIPFSSHFLGVHFDSQVAAVFYGINISLLTIVFIFMDRYSIKAQHIESEIISLRVKKQGEVRQYITLFCNLIGITFCFFSIPLTIFFFLLPVFFNIIPGALNKLERIFGFRIE